MSQLGSESPGFNGVDPDGLRELARTVEARAEHLLAEAAQAADVGEAMAAPLPLRAAERLKGTASDLAVWSRDVEHRIVAIQAVQRAAIDVLSTFVHGIVVGAASLDDVQTSRLLLQRDLAQTYRNADTALLDVAMSGEVAERRLHTLVAALDGSDLVQLVDMLIGGGHDVSAVATIGAAAGTLPWGVVLAVLERLEKRLEYGDLAASVLAGNLVSGVAGETRPRVARWLAARPTLVASVIYGAAVSGEGRVWSNENPDHIADVLTELEDVERIAAVIVELVAARHGGVAGPDLERLDRAILALIDIEPRSVMTQLATVADPKAVTMVAWMRRLVAADHGPGVVGSVVADVAGPDGLDAAWFSLPGPSRRFDNAVTAAYLATSLSIAVEREAQDAHTGIAGIAWAAALGEILIPVVGRATRAIEVLIPAGFTVGVGTAARAADQRIGDSMDVLLERIAERFEVPADADVAELARALDVFDEHRDELVDHWEDRR